MDTTCHDGACAKCWGAKYIVLGIVVLVTAVYQIEYIWHVLGVLLILKGILKLVMLTCSHCEPMSIKKGKK